MTSSWDAAIPALISGGFGAGVATISVALIQTWGRKSESRANAADLITDAAGALAVRQGETIVRLESRVDRQAYAIIQLTAVLDELLPHLDLTVVERSKLAKVVNVAKLAL